MNSGGVLSCAVLQRTATASYDMPPTPLDQLPSYPPFVDKVVSLPEAAHLAGVSPDTLRRCHKRQELTIIKLSPRRVGVRLSDLKAFIDGRAA
jgi:hypothetical protein